MGDGTWRGTHVPSTRPVPSGSLSDNTALRRMAGLPGSTSRRLTVTGDCVEMDSTASWVASSAVAFSSYRSGIAAIRSGRPEAQSTVNGTGVGVCDLSPSGVPPVAQSRTTFSSRAEIWRCAAFTKSCGSIFSLSVSGDDAGWAPSNSVRSDSAHGNASSYLSSDMPPTPPSTWHRPHRFRNT